MASDAPWLVSVLSGGVSVVTATISVVKYRMRLKFYEHVFDRNGDRLDLESAGKVIHPRWTAASDASSRRRARNAVARKPAQQRNPPRKGAYGV